MKIATALESVKIMFNVSLLHKAYSIFIKNFKWIEDNDESFIWLDKYENYEFCKYCFWWDDIRPIEIKNIIKHVFEHGWQLGYLFAKEKNNE